MRGLALIFLCVTAFGQAFEIRGIVQESGTNAPIGGAEVTIKEFVTVDNIVTPKLIATILTNPRGEYSFHPEHEANFYIEARKDGYDDATSRGNPGLTPAAEQPASLTKAHPVANVSSLLLIRPAQLSGKIVDGDGNPCPNQLLIIRGSHTFLSIRVTTDATGAFRLTGVQPGQYLIRISPTEMGVPEVIPYADAESDKVDEGAEFGYWPGAVSDPARALPIKVDPGSRVNVGTLVVRTLKYPRVRLTVEGECKAGTWAFMFTTGYWVNGAAGFMPRPCMPDMLLKFVPALGGKVHMADLRSKRWASADVAPNDRGTPTVLRIVDPVSIPVHVVPPDGMTLASVGKIQVGFAPADRTLPFGNQATIEPDAAGRAVVPDVPWSTIRVSAMPLQSDLYVKTIRYYGGPLNGPAFKSVAGGTLELELDNLAPVLSGAVATNRESTVVLLVRWPAVNEIYAGAAPPFQFQERVGADGKYSMRLAPAEYRAIAIGESRMMAVSSSELRDLLGKGERVVIERGEEKTLDLNVTAR